MFHIGNGEDSSLLRYYAMSLGIQLLMIQKFGFTHSQTVCTLSKHKLHNQTMLRISTIYRVPKSKKGL